jgi:3-hydroxybutyrate dehydrogenase
MLADRRVMVTGAASGIGRAIVDRMLTDTAADVIAVDRDHERLMELKAHRQAWRLTTIHCDLANRAAVADLPTDVDVLVNNAGRLDPGALAGYDLDAAEWTLRVMLHAPMQLTAQVLPYMIAAGDAVVINMGSVYSIIGGDDKGAYDVAKHALVGLTRKIALENGPFVRSVLVCPAHVESPLLDRQCVDEAAMLGVSAAAREAALRGQIPTGRFVTPEEVAANVVFLCSPHARSITGSVYPIDGGWTAGTRSRPA